MGILPLSAGQIDSGTTIKTYKDNILGKHTYKFDFEKNEFVTDVMGNVLTTSNPNEMLEQVVNKILHDRRYKNLIYPDYYGNELDLILSQDDPFEIVECELKRVYTEALVYHPLIESLSDFEISNDGDKVTCEFIVHGVDGTVVHRTEELNYANDRL